MQNHWQSKKLIFEYYAIDKRVSEHFSGMSKQEPSWEPSVSLHDIVLGGILIWNVFVNCSGIGRRAQHHLFELCDVIERSKARGRCHGDISTSTVRTGTTSSFSDYVQPGITGARFTVRPWNHTKVRDILMKCSQSKHFNAVPNRDMFYAGT
jgi:hypothetical protein